MGIRAVALLGPEFCDRRGDFGTFRHSLCAGCRHYGHNLGAARCCVTQPHRCLLNTPNFLVRFAVDLLQILTQAVKKSASLL
jgi:hypothetical protein